MIVTPRNDNMVFYGFPKYFNDDRMAVTWRITSKCNYNCHYCGIADRTAKHPDVELIKKGVDFIAGFEHPEIRLYMTGGEITIHPNIMEIIEYLFEKFAHTDRTLYFNMWSNLWRKKEWYENILKYTEKYPNIIVNILSSYHPKIVTLESFLEKFNYLYEKYNIYAFSYMIIDQSCLDQVNEKIDLLIPKSFYFQPLHCNFAMLDGMEGKGVTERIYNEEYLPNEYVRIFYENGEYSYSVSNRRILNPYFKNFICETFKRSCYIRPNGDIHNCYMHRNATTPLHVTQPDIHELIKNTPLTRCISAKGCECDFSFPKYHMKHYRALKDIDFKFIKENMKERC